MRIRKKDNGRIAPSKGVNDQRDLLLISDLCLKDRSSNWKLIANIKFVISWPWAF